jgi:hypothetical protein
MASQGNVDEGQEAFDRILAALRGLRYGTVTAVVQDGMVVQVERTEKVRLERREQREAARPPGLRAGPSR